MIRADIEATKHGQRQVQGGWVLSIFVHPDDMNDALAACPLGTHFTVSFQERNEFGEKQGSGAYDAKAVQRAALLCKDPQFRIFAAEGVTGIHMLDESMADDWLKSKLGIKSKKEIGSDPVVRHKFLVLMDHFNKWKLTRSAEDEAGV